jgi:hypothetical protein
MLGKYGMALQDHLNEIRYKGVHTSFELFRPDALSGYENKAVYILEYKNYVEVKDAF